MDNDFNAKLNEILEDMLRSYDGMNLPGFANKVSMVRDIAKPVGENTVSREMYEQLRDDYVARFFGREPTNKVVETELEKAQASDAEMSDAVEAESADDGDYEPKQLEFEDI